MTVVSEKEAAAVRCPICDLDAINKYGRSKTGKQRFLCLMCGRQFTPGIRRIKIYNRPFCSECGKTMNLYRREEVIMRFRCSGYPECRSYKKIKIKEGEFELLYS